MFLLLEPDSRTSLCLLMRERAALLGASKSWDWRRRLFWPTSGMLLVMLIIELWLFPRLSAKIPVGAAFSLVAGL